MLPNFLRVIVVFLFLTNRSVADDWHQWRGPNRNGVALSSPPLASAWSSDGPKLVWESGVINGKGHGSVTIARGHVYLFVNDQRDVPFPERIVTESTLRKLDWDKRMPPADILAKVELERVSRKQRRVRGKERNEWAQKWVMDNLGEEDRKKYQSFIRRRLDKGEFAVPLEVYEKLETVINKKFENQKALDNWLDEQKIGFKLQERINQSIEITRVAADDRVICLNAANGKVVWDKKFEGTPSSNEASSTPCVVDDRLLVVTTKDVRCLHADTGAELWAVPVKSNGVPSSFAVQGDVAVVLAKHLMAFNLKSGKVLWIQEKVEGNRSSPVIWHKNEAGYVICSTKKNEIACVALDSGELRWIAEGGGDATCVIAGDILVSNSRKKEIGIIAYQLTAEKAIKLWTGKVNVEGLSTPVIYGDRVHVVAGETVCLDLKSGGIVWRGKGGSRITSPLIADGKLFAVLNGSRLVMLDAAAENFTVLSSVRVKGSRCASPGFVDGRLYVRMDRGVSCFDLTKQANPPSD